MKDNENKTKQEPDKQYSDLCIIIKKLDSISDHIFGQVQDMLAIFEQKMLSKMDEHLDRYERRMSETTREFSEEMKRHSDILKKHEIDIYTIDGKAEAVRKQIMDMEVKSSCDNINPTTWNVIPKKWMITVGILITTILAIDIVALIYAVGKIMDIAQK